MFFLRKVVFLRFLFANRFFFGRQKSVRIPLGGFAFVYSLFRESCLCIYIYIFFFFSFYLQAFAGVLLCICRLLNNFYAIKHDIILCESKYFLYICDINILHQYSLGTVVPLEMVFAGYFFIPSRTFSLSEILCKRNFPETFSRTKM